MLCGQRLVRYRILLVVVSGVVVVLMVVVVSVVVVVVVVVLVYVMHHSFMVLHFVPAAIITAAMEMLGGGPEIASSCRKPEIMADAAYAMVTRNSLSFTGNFAIDEEVLREAGVEDMEQYACVPG